MSIYFGPLADTHRVPEVVLRHVDGPYLLCRDGSMRWLTLWERILFFLKVTDASTLDKTPYPVLDNSDLNRLLKEATAKTQKTV